MTFNLNKMQQHMIDSTSQFTIVACGRGSGMTSGLCHVAKSLIQDGQQRLVTIAASSYKKGDFEVVPEFKKMISTDSNWRYSRFSRFFTHKNGGKVKVVDKDSIRLGYDDVLLIDNVDQFETTHIRNLIKGSYVYKNRLYFTTCPDYCGNGFEQWDGELLNKRLLNKDIWKYIPEFKAQPEHYKQCVNVITNFSFEENPALKFSHYGELLNNLPPLEYEKVVGNWRGY